MWKSFIFCGFIIQGFVGPQLTLILILNRSQKVHKVETSRWRNVHLPLIVVWFLLNYKSKSQEAVSLVDSAIS